MIPRPAVLLVVLTFAAPVLAQNAPDYEECRLHAIFPAGGQQGESVAVEFFGVKAGLASANDIVIDGPPGVVVGDVKNISAAVVRATLNIAADAPPGRRMLRVKSERSGLTNMGFFMVGRLAERIEQENNNEPAKAEAIDLPVVVNGRVNPELDIDCFRFEARAGQRIVAAVLAHAFDFHGNGRTTRGFVDASLELLDAHGRVIAEGSDTIGLDPLVELTVPADGTYVARVQLGGWQGFPEAVYRLTIGEVPLATSVFPPGGQRGKDVEVEFSGPNLASARQRISVPSGSSMPLEFVWHDGPAAGDCDVPFVFGDDPECVEAEPNSDRQQATPLSLPMTANGRFDEPGDTDWYRLTLAKNQTITLETIAQRHLRSPVDTHLEVFDAAGMPVAENDDAKEQLGEQPHDFQTLDSRLGFTAKKRGDYFIRVSEQLGGTGSRAVYRLTVAEAKPNFQLYVWPDAVPVWGPGSTAAMLVKIERFGLNDDIELTVEGLPDGWRGSTAMALGSTLERPVQNHLLHAFVTITAPADAPIGAMAEFQVVGRRICDGEPLLRVAQPMTFYLTGDRGLYRVTPQARAVVAQPQGPWLEPATLQVMLPRGGKSTLQVKVHGAEGLDKLPIVVNLATNAVRCNFGPPATLPIKDGKIDVPISVGAEMPIGTHTICVARGWGSDTRKGMPGPCTTLIQLKVTEPTQTAKAP